jgi:hypothetical protein
MKRNLALGALLCLAVSGCAGGTAPAAAPAVTYTVTQMVTTTVTATPTAEVSQAAPVAQETTPVVEQPKPASALIPANVAGMNAEALDDDLKSLGFKKVIYNSDTGKTVLLLSNWTVTGIDSPGVEQSTDKAVVVHVTK